MDRSTTVKLVMSAVREKDIVVASTGYIAREVYGVKDRPLNFYMMGSMGNALGIGIGLAMHTDRKVIVINGDGSVLMSLGTMITARKLKLENLIHYILDNGCHESTGGQPTSSHGFDFRLLDDKFFPSTFRYIVEGGSAVPPRIPLTPKGITERFLNALSSRSDQQVKS